MSDIILSVFGLKLECKNIIFIELTRTHVNFTSYTLVVCRQNNDSQRVSDIIINNSKYVFAGKKPPKRVFGPHIYAVIGLNKWSLPFNSLISHLYTGTT